MFTVNLIGIGFNFLPILKIFSGGCEPEVEGDGSRVVVAIGKRETAIYLKRLRRRWRKPVSYQCSNPISVSSSTCIHYKLCLDFTQEKTELKVNVFLKVGHQRGSKLVSPLGVSSVLI